MFKVHLVNIMCGQITLQGQQLTIKVKNKKYSDQFANVCKLMHYFKKFANLW